MKKKMIWIVCTIVVVIVVLPLMKENLEKEELNEQTRSQLDGEFIELKDGFTHYELKGQKDRKTIVLVHGNAAPCVTWDNNVDALLQSGFRVLRYDVFGHGFSDRPELDKYTREFYDNQLVELLDKLSITDPIYLVGTSQGGSISTYFTAKHPDKVEKLALIAPLFDSFEEQDKAAMLKPPFIGEYIIRLVGDKKLIDPSNGFYYEKKQDALRSKLKKQIHFKGKKRAYLANIRGDGLNDATAVYTEVKKTGIPLLLTWARQDKIISGESMSRLRKLIPVIRYHEIENAGHLAHYETPEKINPILIKFFNE
ncbi:MAG: alpha/beta hydrolase [Spirochaetes bacterium]|nr:alpha/beta hydrolase [Spirochaetota bacterium]